MATTSSGLTPLCGSLPIRVRAISIDFRHARHAAYEHQLVDFFLRQLRVFQTRLHRRYRSLEQIIAELLEFRARQFLLNVLRPTRIRRDERQIDFIFLSGRKRDLRLLRFLLDALNRIRLFR